MTEHWTFLTNHAQVLLCIAGDPGMRLRDTAATLSITERTTYGMVIDLADAGYILKQKDGRRNRYETRPISGCRSRPAGTGPSANSWPSWLAANSRGMRRGGALSPVRSTTTRREVEESSALGRPAYAGGDSIV
jgi:hypothetical protein